MPRARYQFTDDDVPVVHRWVHGKLRDSTWPQLDAAHTAREQFPREQPTAIQLQQWCDQYLDAPQWMQLQAVIRAARRNAAETRTVRLSASAHQRLQALAEREQLTLSEVIERYFNDAAIVASTPQEAPPITEPTPAQPPTAAPVPAKRKAPATAPKKKGSAFITTKKGVCHLTIKIGRDNFSIMRIRNYTIDAQDKRDMRRLHPDIAFDWKKIARQLAEKREVCRQYRARRRTPRVPRARDPWYDEPLYGVYDPGRHSLFPMREETRPMPTRTSAQPPQSDWRLPPGVTMQKESLATGAAYVFRHAELGMLGRLVLHGLPSGHCQVSCEVAGDPADPLTAQRRAVLEPLTTALVHQLDAQTATVPGAPWGTPPPGPPSPQRVIESKLMQCARCDAGVALLIFADDATDHGGLEDYARLMYQQIQATNVPTWVIGPPRGEEPLPERPADIVKVWPDREPVCRLRPDEFNPMIDALARAHCR